MSFYTCVQWMTIIWCIVPEISSMIDRIFCHLDHFLSFYPPDNSKNQNFEKNEKKKCLERLSFYTSVPKLTITWCMVPEIWSAWQTEFFVILDHFFPFYHPLMIPNIKILKKMEKMPGNIISFYTYMCTINEDNMIHGSWNIRCERQKILIFWAIFCPFSPLKTWKIKILKKWKKTTRDIINLHKCTKNDNHMVYGSWDMKSDRQNYLSFGTVFCHFTPLTVR